MKIIIFEGTPEEYAATFSGAGITAPVICNLQQSQTEPEPPQQRKRGGKPWVSVIAETDDGGVRKFKSMLAAYKWYKRASCYDSTYRNYLAFTTALKQQPIRFADTVLSVRGVAV